MSKQGSNAMFPPLLPILQVGALNVEQVFTAYSLSSCGLNELRAIARANNSLTTPTWLTEGRLGIGNKC